MDGGGVVATGLLTGLFPSNPTHLLMMASGEQHCSGFLGMFQENNPCFSYKDHTNGGGKKSIRAKRVPNQCLSYSSLCSHKEKKIATTLMGFDVNCFTPAKGM